MANPLADLPASQLYLLGSLLNGFLLLTLLRVLRIQKTWPEITTDPKTQRTVAKDYFKAIAFFAGLLYLLVLVPGIVLLTPSHLVLPLEPGIALVMLAFGLQALKEGSNYLNRKTRDADGPLYEPGPPPQDIAPQVPIPHEQPVVPAPAPEPDK